MQSSCICGKENIKYLFTIKNNINGNSVYPIGWIDTYLEVSWLRLKCKPILGK